MQQGPIKVRLERLDELATAFAAELLAWDERLGMLERDELLAYRRGLEAILGGIRTASVALMRAKERVWQEQRRARASRQQQDEQAPGQDAE